MPKTILGTISNCSSCLFAAIVVIGGLAGCAGEVVAFADGLEEAMVQGENWENYSSWDVEPVALNGDIGAARGLSEIGVVGEAYQDHGFSSVEIHSEEELPSSMVWINLSGDLTKLSTGDVVDQGIGNSDVDSEMNPFESESSETYVDLIGCSGDSKYQWDYDEAADDVTLEVVDEDDDSLEFEITGTLPAEGDATEPMHVRSRFRVAKQQKPL